MSQDIGPDAERNAPEILDLREELYASVESTFSEELESEDLIKRGTITDLVSLFRNEPTAQDILTALENIDSEEGDPVDA